MNTNSSVCSRFLSRSTTAKSYRILHNGMPLSACFVCNHYKADQHMCEPLSRGCWSFAFRCDHKSKTFEAIHNGRNIFLINARQPRTFPNLFTYTFGLFLAACNSLSWAYNCEYTFVATYIASVHICVGFFVVAVYSPRNVNAGSHALSSCRFWCVCVFLVYEYKYIYILLYKPTDWSAFIFSTIFFLLAYCPTDFKQSQCKYTSVVKWDCWMQRQRPIDQAT